MDFRDFLAFVKTLDGKTLTTMAQGKEFEVSVLDHGLEYTPRSTGKPRPHGFKFLERILERYTERGSLHPGDYTDISKNASYALVLIEKYLEARGDAPPRATSQQSAERSAIASARPDRPPARKTCAEALRETLRPGDVVSYRELYDRVKALGVWADDTIWLHLMACVVNLPVARERWPSLRPFLFVRPDGRYELYRSGHHPSVPDNPREGGPR